eukprot:CAMPEP_0170548652 /NCGR_PEP_ID=MMETSP0211-20121228/6902_1 /TAXON_ID=311385 /ORGANISM="Pseudokeronopsis sp., Strain OXSARD2" /LENGTH=106 /DNA_ID=CAMNT_0010854267 /DNA_START=1151 /DNA_END=1471 /DNA_ORIENTATION=-
MRKVLPNPNVMSIEEPNPVIFILIKLHFHPHQLYMVDLQQVIPDFVANLEAVVNRRESLELLIIHAKLLEVKLNFSIVGYLDVPFFVFLVEWSLEGEDKWFSQPDL